MPPRKKAPALEPDTTVNLPISELRLYQRNPRKGNVGAVAASLKVNGQYRPIVVNIGTHTGRKLEVLAGNHTLKAFRSLAQREPSGGWDQISVHLVDVDEDQAKRIVLADNKTSEAGGYDNTALAELLGDVREAVGGLDGTGFSAADLDALIPADVNLSDDVDLVDEDELPDPGPGRGNPVIAYSIVFDTAEQKRLWTEFMSWLKRQHPDLTVGERLHAYIENQAEIAGENEHDAD